MSLAVPMRECIKCRVAAYSEYDLTQFACALGKFGDNINILEVAIKYLKERGSYGRVNKCLLF